MVQEETMKAPTPTHLHTSPKVLILQWLEDHISLFYLFRPLQFVTTLNYHNTEVA